MSVDPASGMRAPILQFSTGEEREYSVGFCDAFAKGLKTDDSVNSFVEIFSGPNAPLSHSIGRAKGAAVPGNSKIHSDERGVKRELQKLQQLSCPPNIPDTIREECPHAN